MSIVGSQNNHDNFLLEWTETLAHMGDLMFEYIKAGSSLYHLFVPLEGFIHCSKKIIK